MAEVARRQAQALVPLLLVAGVALLALLAFNLRNLDSREERLPPPPFTEPSPAEGAVRGSGASLRALFVTVLLTFGVLILALSVTLWRKGVKVWKLVTVWELLGYLLATVFLVAIFLYYESVVAGLSEFVRWVTGTRDSGGGGAGGVTGTPVARTVSTALLVVAIGVVVFYAIVFAAAFLPRMYRVIAEAPPDVGRSKKELARAVRTAIRDLEAGGEFRAIVLRCYKSMVLLFEAHGLRSDPSQTAREFEADALRAIGVSREGIDDLTSLFEEARYSAHPIRADQRDTALECLRAIRGQLEAGA